MRGPTSSPRRRYRVLVGVGALLLFAALAVGPLVGSTSLRADRVLAGITDWDANPDAAIFFMLRLPRVLLAAIVGASLALAGATFQSLLRNPLATPFTLGVSAGASLAAVLAQRLLPAGGASELAVPGAALFGAVMAAAAVLAISVRRRDVPTTVLLLAGVTLNFTIGAAVLLLHYFADHTETARMIRWMMGDLEGTTYRLLGLLLVASAPAWWTLLRAGRELNLLSLGVEEARAHGVDARRAMLAGFAGSAWVTGLAVAVAGPVGFVGIIVPHGVRLLGGADSRVVLPATFLGGAAFLIACDTAARTLLAPVELPIGVVTACLGGPFFLGLLLRRRVGP